MEAIIKSVEFYYLHMAKRVRKQSVITENISLPPDEQIRETARDILANEPVQPVDNKYAPVKLVLCRIAAGQSIRKEELTTVNPFYLNRTLTRLVLQGFIQKPTKETVDAPLLTERGKRWILKYALENLNIATPKSWDGKWRLILYDVARQKASLRNIFRATLRRLGFLNVQESAWLFPYPCEKEVNFLRQYCGMGDEVIYIICHKIERDESYRTHFGLK